jgi:hypothetical protein
MPCTLKKSPGPQADLGGLAALGHMVGPMPATKLSSAARARTLLQLERRPGFVDIPGAMEQTTMNERLPTAAARRINWPSVITVISAAILIGAEVFGAAYAAGWAIGEWLAIGQLGVYILQALFFVGGVFVMAAFIRAAQRVEPFTTRS